MSAGDFDQRRGAPAVPRWFMDVLHEVIYADGRDGHLAIQTLSAMMDPPSPSDPYILTEWARGLSQTRIADVLLKSRHRVCRRIAAMRRRLGAAMLRRIHGNMAVANALIPFDFENGAYIPNVRLVVDRLASLSVVELGVLSALLRLLPEDETLAIVGISHTWYHIVTARLSAAFRLTFPGREKVSSR